MSEQLLFIDGEELTLADVVAVSRGGRPVALTEEAAARIQAAAAFVEGLADGGEPVYGISTGFGSFASVTISPEQRRQLQVNLLRSHAVGVGDPYPDDVVRAMLLLRANALAKGHSGAQPATVQLLLEMLNRGVTPVVPSKGSLGASGDLAPLAHMALVLIGEGEATYGGHRLPGLLALRQAGLEPVTLQAKEGLALTNGTQAMAALGALAAWDALALLRTADLVAALTVEALRGIVTAYDERIAAVRPHPGQATVAANLRRALAGSARATRQGEARVQDAYALRCVPQVHGASRDAWGYVHGVLVTEMNAATDNPLLFPEAGDVLSGGNFHGQPLALALDFLGIAIAELANISERRTERLLNPALSGLPAFLTGDGGLHSGLMILQYTAAALVSENKVLAHPASVDSIPTSANQEDHVSMGNTSARKLREIVWNVTRVLAIETICAAQAVDLAHRIGVAQGPLGEGTSAVHDAVRELVPYAEDDVSLAAEIEVVAAAIADGRFIAAAEQAAGPVL